MTYAEYGERRARVQAHKLTHHISDPVERQKMIESLMKTFVPVYTQLAEALGQSWVQTHPGLNVNDC